MASRLGQRREGPKRLTRLKLFYAIVAFTTLMLLLAVLLSLLPQTESTKEIIGLCSNGCFLGFGAIMNTFAPKG